MNGLHELLIVWALTVAGAGLPDSAKVDFNRDVRPILSDKCYRCHGPDEGERKAKLRLDNKDDVFAPRKSGAPVVPGKSAESLLFARITASSPDDRMPPAESGKSLSAAEVDVLQRWIDQGAEWSRHWSFVAPHRPPVPAPSSDLADAASAAGAAADRAEPARNEIDLFVRARMASSGLEPAPPADPVTLIRRVTLDLTGMPPTPAEVEAFLADRSASAYESLVDRLLSSARHGEHMARYWLDAVRYGDSHGLHFDNERSLWPYRDWVIRAFSENKPFDAFTVEQIAGDLLPEPTLDQRVATGFNRCNVTTSEGGSIDEEVLVRYAVDRVEAVGTVWLGLTVGCAVCHDHKFDPISQKEFYQLFAFFNSFEESAMDGNALLPPPFIKVPTKEQAAMMASLKGEAQALRERLDGPIPEIDAAQEKWAVALGEKLRSQWRVLEPVQVAASGGSSFKRLDDSSVLAEGPGPDKDVYEIVLSPPREPLTAIRLEALQDESHPQGGIGRADNANFVLNEVEASVVYPATTGAAQRPAQAVEFLAAQADYSQKDYDIARTIDGDTATGWAIDGAARKENRTAVFFPRQPVSVEEGALLRLRLVQEHGGRHTIGRFRVSVSSDGDLSPPTLGPWKMIGPFVAASGEEAYNTEYGPENKLDLSEAYQDGKLRWSDRPELIDGQVYATGQEIGSNYFFRVLRAATARSISISLGSDDGLKVWLNGQLKLDRKVSRGAAPDQDRVTLDLVPGENLLLLKVVNFGGASGLYFKQLDGESRQVALDLGSLLTVAPDRRSDADNKRLRDYYRSNYSGDWARLKVQAEELDKKAQAIDAQVSSTMVTQEMAQRRDAFVLRRGQYTQKGEKVSPGMPAVLPPLGEGAPPNRLGLAKWLVSRDHPLTARVTVNRFWQQYFGVGIVKTAVDFGSRGEWPVNPELLDWLAIDFMESGWDVKRLQKLIVMSAAYRQSARVTPEGLEKDPENRLLARAPRFRMDAEMIRDSALAISGLLVERIGGPSVKPYQPSGIWEAVGFLGSNTAIYKQDQGDALYRRGLYTFWKRTAPPPVLSLFDAPSRETCTALRPRTNTPLQALALMNDVQYFEASRRLAERMMHEGGSDPASRIAHAFRLATARQPRPDELEVLLDNYQAHAAEYQTDAAAALEAVSVGESKRDEALDVKELAAYTMVASLILNLDETLTKG